MNIHAYNSIRNRRFALRTSVCRRAEGAFGMELEFTA
jgi:hypothetical protein